MTLYDQAVLAFQEKRFQKSKRFIEEGVKENDTGCIYLIGAMLHDGCEELEITQNQSEAFHYLEEACNRYWPDAHFFLGKLLIPVDVNHAIIHFKTAAFFEHPMAMHMLALVYKSIGETVKYYAWNDVAEHYGCDAATAINNKLKKGGLSVMFVNKDKVRETSKFIKAEISLFHTFLLLKGDKSTVINHIAKAEL